MENLEIIVTDITVKAKQEINSNLISYDRLFNVINFNVFRNDLKVITGTYFIDINKLDIQNNNYQLGDFELYKTILESCILIINN